MKIENTNTVIIPPVQEKSFDALFLKSILIQADSVDKARITIEAVPFDYDTKQMAGLENRIMISTDKLWEAASEVPEVAQAIGAIFAAVKPLKEWLEPVEPEEI